MIDFFRNKKNTVIILGILLLIASVYLFGLIFYSSHFLPESYVSGVDVSSLSIAKANEKLSEIDPVLKVIEKHANGTTPHYDTIRMKDISSDAAYDTSETVKRQNILLWFTALSGKKEYECYKVSGTPDDQKINAQIDKLYCLQSENISLPVNAHLEISNGNVVLKPANNGSYINSDIARQTISYNLKNYFEGIENSTVDLRSLYESAAIFEDDPIFEQKEAVLDKVINKKIDIVLDESKTVELHKDEICELIKVVDSDPVSDQDKVGAYLINMAKEYDKAGSYLDKSDLLNKLNVALCANEDASVEAKWNNEKPLRKIEVDISDQTLFYYEDNQLLLTSPIVSGNGALTDATPTGNFTIHRKNQNSTLIGADYVEHVDYWVGFDETGRVYGLHDAQWREEDQFGGDIYLSYPSRGCVNMPLEKISTIFDRLDLGDEVIIHD